MESIGRLASGVAHDLNNLLTPILGFGGLLLDDFSPDDPRKGSVQQIVRAAEKSRDLVRQLMAFGRKQVLEFRPLDLNAVVTEFEKLLRHTLHEDIALEVIPAPSIPAVLGDIGQLEQVVMNLAVNAQDAMPAGGRLTIETSVADLDAVYAKAHSGVTLGRYVLLAISDTGSGMDAEIQEHIFEPFFTTKEKGKGTGLGLATVYGIVKQHGGNIWVYSEPGKGTTFKIYLPAVETAAEPVEVEHVIPAEDLCGTETILLAEDDALIRSLAQGILEHQGYTVLSADNGRAALSVLANHDGPVQLLLSDVVMPETNGRELLASISRDYPAMKVLYMSGYAENVIAHHGVLDAGVQFIQKPFTVQALAVRVRQTLDDGERGPQ
jgi:two-component system cell cycle sensor histidine kinase/response regulator CckA